jgi:hypothetical protein
MNASNGDSELIPGNIPALIQHLWDLYESMSRDPALESGAEHIRQAAIDLEEARKVAFEVYQEERRKKKQPATSRPQETENALEKANWLRAARPASPLKH